MTKKYKIDNWSQYNRALEQRGSLTLWISDDVLKKWHNPPHEYKNGRPREYSDEAILAFLIVRSTFKLPLRATRGFFLSLVLLLSLAIRIPSCSQICRRAKELGTALKRLSNKCPKDLVIDSTGLKVYGEGEWKVRQHGIGKRRTWKKLHLGVDPETHEIIIADLTGNNVGDGETGEKMIKKAPRSIEKVYGDGAYDGSSFREAVLAKGARAIVPPPKNAVVGKGSEGARKLRDDAVKAIEGLGGEEEGRKLWKRLEGYHIRSLAETAMFRWKQLLGGNLYSRCWENQRTEAFVKCFIMNSMTRLGMPRGRWVEAS